jgi:hypothetical protein
MPQGCDIAPQPENSLNPARSHGRFPVMSGVAMSQQRVTAQALAGMTGISRSYLGKRLRDEVPFSLNDVQAISEALGLKLPEL